MISNYFVGCMGCIKIVDDFGKSERLAVNCIAFKRILQDLKRHCSISKDCNPVK